jgi:O-acetyl-ADP-ribose deacetylase (regulator of RNase III)
VSNFLRALRAAGINGDTLNRASQTAHEEPSEGSLLSDAGVTLPRDNDYTLHLKVSDPDEVRFFRGDLTEDPSDAIVNAANSDLLPGGGLCGAINYKGGAEIFRECGRIRRSKGPLAPGGAVPTTAGQRPSKYVIHAVGPVWEGGTRGEAGILARCYRESMRVADDLALHSIAFPAISTGIFRYPVVQAASVAIPTVIASLIIARHLVLVSFVLFDKVTLDTFATAALTQRQPESDRSYEVSISI